MRSYLFGCTCVTQAKGALHAMHVVLYLPGLQLLKQAAVFLARRVPETNDARAATRVRCAAHSTKSTAATDLGANRKRPAPEDTSLSRLCVYPFPQVLLVTVGVGSTRPQRCAAW